MPSSRRFVASMSRLLERTVTGALPATLGGLAALSLSLSAIAQVPSQNNPAPRVHADMGSTGRFQDDKYWGVTNGNRNWNVPVFARTKPGATDLDGWTFPRRAYQQGILTLYTVRAFDNDGQPLADQTDAANNTTTPGAAWANHVPTPQPGNPVPNFYGANYQRAAATPRGDGTNGVPAAQRFVWTPNLINLPLKRYQIEVYIPGADTNENRIGDARYRVTYVVRTNAGLQAQSQFFFASQTGEGWVTLTNQDGTIPYFPMGPNQGVQIELDSTTNQQGANLFVVADAIRLTQASDIVRATPTVTPRHGGRVFAAGTDQPAPGPGRGIDVFVNSGVATGDPVVNDPSNPSTLYQGPIEYVQRSDKFLTFAEGGLDNQGLPLNGGGPTLAPDYRIYNNAGTPSPIFSQQQVIVARTFVVPDPANQTRSVEVSAVYGLDSRTGAEIWRFPDRTYLPNAPAAVARNPRVGDVPALPGIWTVDANLDGQIDPDNEVFIVGNAFGQQPFNSNPYRAPNPPTDPTGNPAGNPHLNQNRNGGISAAITIVPNVLVQGAVQVPTKNAIGDITGVEDAAAGRYAVPVNNAPVRKTVAFVAANNGVLYAIDPYGNNDNRYLPDATNAQNTFGTFRPGTTNALWSFHVTSAPRQNRINRRESQLEYNRRLKGEIPATAAFGVSAPVVAYDREPTEAGFDPTDPTLSSFEMRLFVGNENGVLYALDARADAGIDGNTSTLRRFPFRKGEQTGPATGGIPSRYTAADTPRDIGGNYASTYRADLKWWFETQGSIAAPPSVSTVGLQAGVALQAPPLGPDEREGRRRGVFFTSTEGRVYCVDWEGPVTKGSTDHLDTRQWNGTSGVSDTATDEALNPAPFTAAGLNNNIRFHNAFTTRLSLRSDGTEGTIRPRWTFPNRYRDITGTDNSTNGPTPDPADNSLEKGRRLAEPETLGPIRSAPMILDFPFDANNDGTYDAADPLETKHYVVVAANNPQLEADDPIEGKLYLLDQAGNRRDFLTNPQILDNPPVGNSPNDRVVAAPLDAFAPSAPFSDAAPAYTYRFQYGNTPATRNSPTTVLGADNAPSRRALPTIYAGGAGQLFAVDLDPATGLLQRWRTSTAAQEALGPIPTLNAAVSGEVFDVPADLAAADRLIPMNPAISARGLQARPVMGWVLPLFDDFSNVSAIAITGGPLQNRSNPDGAVPATKPPVPTNDPAPIGALAANLIGQINGNFLTTNPAVPSVNQNIADPLTTSAGTTNPPPTDDIAYQYPMLVATTARGQMHFTSSNLEGEDKTPTGIVDGESSTLGWALLTDQQRANPDHQYLDTVDGPGGPNVGVAIVTNTYFPAMDPSLGAYPAGGDTPPFRPRTPQAGDTHTGQTGFPLDGDGLFYDENGTAANSPAAVVLRVPSYGPDGLPQGTTANEPTSDDINPAGTDVAWIYVGGANGVIYGFTPTLPGLSIVSGTVGGTIVDVSPDDLQEGGAPKVAIVTEDEYNRLIGLAGSGNAQPPDLTQTLEARGIQPFVEWGESLYIVLYDLNAQTGTPATAGRQRVAVNDQITVQLQIAGYSRPITRTVPLARTTPGNALSTYTQGSSIPLGVAFFAYQLDTSSEDNPQTPGRAVTVTVQPQQEQIIARNGAGDVLRGPIVRSTGLRRIGANSQAILQNVPPVFIIANPLAVQAFLTTTTGEQAGVTNPNGYANGIGPFANDADAKSKVVFGTQPASGTEDPDKNIASYHQALANGSAIRRVDSLPRINRNGTVVRNRRINQPLRNDDGEIDPQFYVPIATGMQYASHGSTGSTSLGAQQVNLRLLNRSRLAQLDKIKAEVTDFSWRWWPGASVPNAPLDATTNAPTNPGGFGPNPAMGADGAINPLPWESRPGFVLPWRRTDSNTSADYPDILRSGSADTVQVNGPGGEMVNGTATLPGVNVPVADFNAVNGFGGLINASAAPEQNIAAAVSLAVPKYQPANLAAATNLTSIFQAPDNTGGLSLGFEGIVNGPVQLPRGVDNRKITSDTGNPVPYGYVALVRVYVDSNQNGTHDDFEAYREFEVWVGVPVDMKMKAAAQSPVIDLGAHPHGFGIQNGLIGYVTGTNDPSRIGLVPPPLPTVATDFYRPLLIQNEGNVNLWNLRASQQVSLYNPTSDNFVTTFLGMRSATVDPRFGIAAFESDPLNLGVPNVFPTINTSLDAFFDGAYQTYLQNTLPAAAFTDYYQQLGGKHTLHKPLVGTTQGTLLSIPDAPETVDLGNIAGPAQVTVGFPVGTPRGQYKSPVGNPADVPFTVFEDHDTNVYRAVPAASGGNILPAGPLYNGSNSIHPGAGAVQGGVSGQPGVFRARQITTGADGRQLEYLPHADPTPQLVATVTEAPLTGGLPDLVDTNNTANTSVITGLLPYVDPAPLVSNVNNENRASAALAPAAFRSLSTGNLHTYFARNADPRPGAPFRLYRSSMFWNSNGGFWQARDPFTFITQPNSNTGGWFTAPVEIGNAVLGENTAPFVLHDTIGADGAYANTDGATLFWQNVTQIAANGGRVSNLYFAPLNLTTGAPGAPVPYLTNPDPALLRYAPRAATVYPVYGNTANKTAIVTYYGGQTGRWKLYYGASLADANGTPTGPRTGDQLLQVPSALTSAYDPVPIARYLNDGNNNRYPVVDVYYTGVSRANQNPDIYMTRYALGADRQNAQQVGPNTRMVPQVLPRIEREVLVSPGRDLLWRSRHVAWRRNLQDGPSLPVITLGNVSIGPNGWQYDNSTELLYQSFQRNGQSGVIYVDTSAGTVRFRGAEQAVPQANETVQVSYTPQTYRITTDGVPDTGVYGFLDSGEFRNSDGLLDNGSASGIIRRPVDQPLRKDRVWLFWKKGAQTGQVSTLFYTTRRVGVDLKALVDPATFQPFMGNGESFQLSPATANGNSAIRQISVQVNGADVPFDADAESGRVYVASEFEGLPIRVRVTVVRIADGQQQGGPRAVVLNAVLGWIEENGQQAQEVPMTQAVNEGQAAAFLDRFAPAVGNQYGLGSAFAPNDPTLQPGRVYLFWTSPRARNGINFTPFNVRAYDIYWQTLAPNFEPSALDVSSTGP